MDRASGGERLPGPDKEQCVSNWLQRYSRLCKIWAVFVVMLMLVSCGTPTPSAVPMTATQVPSTPGQSGAPAPTASAQPAVPWNVVPRPVSQASTGGTFVLSAQAGIFVEPASAELKAVGQYLADALMPATGYAFPVQGTTGAPANGSLYLTLTGADPALGPEGYQLTITPELVRLSANQPAGLFHAVQTLRQLLPPAINSATLQSVAWTLGTGTISDSPRFAWRAAMLDVARHFFSVRDVTRYIDLLAYYKINTLHLHLSDDQGWRIQINSWPNLALYGGSLEVGGSPGGYYSQSDYAYLVEYARSRYITIVPEIDMPGHFTAALASYPELTCDGVAPDLFTGTNVGFSSICTTRPVATTFLQDVIGELAALTPGPYIHIGGDEADATQKSDYISFMQQAQAIVVANGKQAIGWEEIAQAPLLPGTIVQHWNLDAGLAAQAVKMGARVIMSPADKAYLDMKYTASTTLGQDWAGLISLETGYSWDPAALVEGVGEKDILGVEAPLWSETLRDLNDLEYLAFPRLLGYAEIAWTPQAERDWSEYKTRLAAQGPHLQALGVHFFASPEIVWP
jgi:hexosaminidase